MVHIYCKAHHQANDLLCSDCETLLQYAFKRIEHCVYGVDKPACSQCPVHCYTPEKRAEIRTVMRFAGPRMLLYHPWLTLQHYWDAWRIKVEKTRSGQGRT